MKRLFSENGINTVNSLSPIGDSEPMLDAIVQKYDYKAVLKQLIVFAMRDEKQSNRNAYDSIARALAFVLPSITD